MAKPPDIPPDEFIERAWRAADDEWKATVIRCVKWFCDTRCSFVIDDVWDAMDDHYPHLIPREPRAIAGVISLFRQAGLIRNSGEYVPSRRRHKSPVPIWKVIKPECEE